MIDMLVFTLLVGVIMGGSLFLTMAGFQSQGAAIARSAASSNVGSAMQLLIRDLQQAKDAVVDPKQQTLRVRYGKLLANGTYDCTVFDDTAEVDYFLGDGKGKPNPNGTLLWRASPNGTTLLCSGVTNATFAIVSPGTVDVSLAATLPSGMSDSMPHRSIFMRNYANSSGS